MFKAGDRVVFVGGYADTGNELTTDNHELVDKILTIARTDAFGNISFDKRDTPFPVFWHAKWFKKSEYCCKMMELRTNPCPDHGFDCGDVTISKTNGTHGIKIPHGVGGGIYVIDFCPWCGTKLN